MKFLQQNRFSLLLMIFLVWMAIGIFPLYCYETDSMHVLAGCGIMVNQGITFPPLWTYEYSMQPLISLVVTVVGKTIPLLTVEHIYCLLIWIASVIFILGCLDFVNKVYHPRNKLYLLLALVLLPEMYAVGMYPNSAIPAAALFVWALCCIWDERYIVGLLLMVIAPLFRVDVLIVYPALLPLLWLRGKSFKQSLFLSIGAAVLIIVLLIFGFWLLNANPLDSFIGYQKWNVEIKRGAVMIAILGYYSITYLILLPLGIVIAVRRNLFKQLFLCLLPIVLLHFVYRSMGCAAKHYLYMSPFVILLGTIAIEYISQRGRTIKLTAFVLLIIISCCSIAKINVKDTSLHYRLPVRFVIKEFRRDNFLWSFGIGAGQHVATYDEHMLGTGYLLYPFYIHYFKQKQQQQTKDALDYLQTKNSSCTLYAVNNYTDDIALPLYLIEEGYRFSIVTQKENGGVRDFYLTKGNRRIHVILISEAERTALIKNYKQSKFPVYFTTGIREFALIYQNIAKTNPKLRKVTDGLYQLTNERID